MDIQKEREAFEKLPEIAKKLRMCEWSYSDQFECYLIEDPCAGFINGAWMAWQAAKTQGVEWISVEDRLPSKDQLCVTMFSEVKNPDRPYLHLKEHFEAGKGLQIFGNRKAIYWLPLPEAKTTQDK